MVLFGRVSCSEQMQSAWKVDIGERTSPATEDDHVTADNGDLNKEWRQRGGSGFGGTKSLYLRPNRLEEALKVDAHNSDLEVGNLQNRRPFRIKGI